MSALTHIIDDAEHVLIEKFGLTPLRPPAELKHMEGRWHGETVALEVQAYHGGPVDYARFVVIEGPSISIGNVLVLGQLPILGVDLVSVGYDQIDAVADLSDIRE